MSTQSDNKRIAKNTLILYVRMLVTMIIGLFTSRIILNTLGVTDFGVYNVVAGVITMFGFLTGSMSSASSRFITFELGKGNPERLKKVFGQCLSIHLIIAIFIVLLGETIGLWFVYEKLQIPVERFSSAVFVYHLSVAASFLNIMIVPYNAAIIAHERMSAFAYITILDVILKLLIVYLLCIFPYDKLIVYAILLFIVQLINQFIYLFYLWKRFEEVKVWFSWDKTLSKEMTSFAGWSLFGNLAGTLFGQGLNILINLFFGPTVNAARGVAVQIQGVIFRFINNFQTALNPQITKKYAAGELESMHKLIYTSSKFSFFLMMFLSLPVFINTEYILVLWLKTVPDYTVSFVRILLLISLTETLANPLIISAQATGKIRIYQQVVGGILLAIVPISYVILKFGAPPYSVFIVHFICAILAQSARVYMLRPMINLSIKDYFNKVVIRVGAVLLFSLLLCCAIHITHSNSSIIYIILDSLSCAVISILLIYFIGFEKNEKNFLISRLKIKFKM